MTNWMSVKLSEEDANFYKFYFKTVGNGAGYIVRAIPKIFKIILHESKNFPDNELKLMIDAFKEVQLTPQMAGQHLLIQCSDKMDIDKLDEKWEVDRKTFLSKVESLSIFSRAILEIWAHGFWERKDNEMEDWIKPLQGE